MRLWHEQMIPKLPNHLFCYHTLIMDEMNRRGYQVAIEWRDKNYRGKIAESYSNLEEVKINTPIYKEHNEAYLLECIDNLRLKGIEIEE